mmetsp:Transcript_26235/g.36777  ORF Transcript_26235/g.36777 Transcript_26235/m.36777 type:complete len:90 (+) Transcript_26235:52-321(+)
MVLISMLLGAAPCSEADGSYDLCLTNFEKFWSTKLEAALSADFVDDNDSEIMMLRKFVAKLVKLDPKKRMDIGKIKKSDWYKGETFTDE